MDDRWEQMDLLEKNDKHYHSWFWEELKNAIGHLRPKQYYGHYFDKLN